MSTSKQLLRSRLWQWRLPERRTLLIFGDLVTATLALLVALYTWGVSERFSGFTVEFLQKRVPFWFYFLPLVWIFLMVELYNVHSASDWGKTVRGVAMAVLIGLVLYLALFFYYSDPPNSLLPRRGAASFLMAVFVLSLVWRWIYIRVFTQPQFLRRVLLVGGGSNGQIMLQIVNHLKVKPFVLVGVVDDDHRKLGTFIEGYQVIGPSETLRKLIEENKITDIIVAISGEMQSGLFQALLDAQELGVEIIRMPRLYEELLGRVPVRSLEATWLLRSFVDDYRVSGFYELGKRLLDILGAIVGLVITLITLPFVGLLVLWDDGWPIFYAQTRAGRGGEPYQIFKYRTMRKDAEADGLPRWAKEDDERTTRSGRFLRKSHLDELPQFINVLRGEMSLVGPRAERPELMLIFQKNIPFYRARLLVKPGITGWAQVNFGYASTTEETQIKLEYDLYYIKNRSMLMDILILMRTPAMMLGFRGR